jgi:hypothetical protein
MPAFLSLLFSRAGIVALGGLGLLLLFGVQEARLKSAQHAQQKAQEAVAACQASVAQQNAAIDLMRQRSAAAMASSTEALKQAEPRARKYTQASDAIHIPATAEPECQRYRDVDADLLKAYP